MSVARSLKSAVRTLHLWLGLSVGVLLAITGLSGSILVFYVELDQALHPAIQGNAAIASPANWQQAYQSLIDTFPTHTGPWRLEVSDNPGVIPARYNNPPETAGEDFAPMLVWLSADGKQVLRQDFWGQTAMTWLYDLHYRLLLEAPGGTLLGYLGLAMLVLLLSGVWAWWPRRLTHLAKALKFKTPASTSRRLYDLHKLTGLWGLLLLLLLTLTGVMLALPDETSAVLSATIGEPHSPRAPPLRWSSDERLSVDDALTAARRALPSATLSWIEVPGNGSGAYSFRFQVSGDPSRRFPHSYVYVHPVSGEILETFNIRDMGPASTVKNWLHPLHNGAVAGLPGRLLLFIAGLLPTVMLITGWLRWRGSRQRLTASRAGHQLP